MSERILYKCTRCLTTYVVPPTGNCPECNNDEVLEVYVGEPGSESRRPVTDAQGKPQTHAPRWWVFREGPHGRRI